MRLLGPGDHHWSFLRQTILEGQARGPLITDAQLAALTIEHGGMLCTTDRDFSRFPGLRWREPDRLTGSRRLDVSLWLDGFVNEFSS